MTDSKKEFDICGYCCKWANGLDGKSPQAVADAYPKMMRKVLKERFGMGRDVAEQFIEEACYGNWLKMHMTDVERHVGAEVYAEMLRDDVWYCSDRWSWDRVIRVQWLYRRLKDKCERENHDR